MQRDPIAVLEATLADVRSTALQGNGHEKAEEVPWGDPDMAMVKPHRRAAPKLPLEVFGPIWAEWTADAAEAKGAPPDFVAMALVAATGGMVANVRRGSPWPGWVEPPIVWVAEVGLPSSGKSPAIDAVTELVILLEQELDADFGDRARDNMTAREMAKAKRERWEAEVRTAVKGNLPPPEPPRDVEPPEPPARRRLLMNNSTTEQIVRIVAANERAVLLHRDELAGWLGAMDKYGGNGADRATYLEAFGGRSYVVDRVKDGGSVRVPFLSVGVLGGIQPDRLGTMLLAGDDDGAAARFLYTWPEPRRPTRPRRSPNNTAALGALRRLLTLGQDEQDGRKTPRVLPFAPPAADHVQAWREQVAAMEPAASGLFLSWLGKLPGYAVRLAVLIELLWWAAEGIGTPEPAQISERATVAAIAFLESYCIGMAQRAFGEAALPETDRDALALARWLMAQSPMPKVVNARDLRHADALPTRVAARYDAALAELADAGWVRPTPSAGGPGRSRKDWSVNPKLSEAAHG